MPHWNTVGLVESCLVRDAHVVFAAYADSDDKAEKQHLDRHLQKYENDPDDLK